MLPRLINSKKSFALSLLINLWVFLSLAFSRSSSSLTFWLLLLFDCTWNNKNTFCERPYTSKIFEIFEALWCFCFRFQSFHFCLVLIFIPSLCTVSTTSFYFTTEFHNNVFSIQTQNANSWNQALFIEATKKKLLVHNSFVI